MSKLPNRYHPFEIGKCNIFTPQNTYSTGSDSKPSSVRTADVNGDTINPTLLSQSLFNFIIEMEIK